MDDCCGGGGPASPIPNPGLSVWPPTDYTGTVPFIPGVETPLMFWQGMADASTILGGDPAFSPDDDPALVTLVDVRNLPYRRHRGFPQACFSGPADCHQVFDLAIPQNWQFHCKMLEYSYNPLPIMGQYLQTICPCLNRGRFVPNSDAATPGSFMADTNDWTLIYISGTDNFQQKALQGASSVLGPIAGDNYGTLLFWYTNFQRIARRIIDQEIAIRPNWFIAGHSYGGALASILAAVVKRADPSRNVNLFTIGCPCPGDARLYEMLSTVNQVNLQNTGDPVCSMPPAGANLQAVWSLLTVPLRNTWQVWFPPQRRVNISPTGVRTNINEGAVEFGTLQTLVNAIVDGVPPADYPAHQASVYYARASVVQ